MFDRHRIIPDGVADSVRAAILPFIDPTSKPRFLDIGAGTGRIGQAFILNDDYVAVDLSFGMLREFVRRRKIDNQYVIRLVQADGEHLPFHDATFDVVMLINVIGAAHNWNNVVVESRRVLRAHGALVVAHVVMPSDGVDTRMKKHLASFLKEAGIRPYHMNGRSDIPYSVSQFPESAVRIVAAEWFAKRTPDAFLDRQPTGARFSALPAPIKEAALAELRSWAIATFGSLDVVFTEKHQFELQVFKFERERR